MSPLCTVPWYRIVLYWSLFGLCLFAWWLYHWNQWKLIKTHLTRHNDHKCVTMRTNPHWCASHINLQYKVHGKVCWKLATMHVDTCRCAFCCTAIDFSWEHIAGKCVSVIPMFVHSRRIELGWAPVINFGYDGRASEKQLFLMCAVWHLGGVRCEKKKATCLLFYAVQVTACQCAVVH